MSISELSLYVRHIFSSLSLTILFKIIPPRQQAIGTQCQGLGYKAAWDLERGAELRWDHSQFGA